MRARRVKDSMFPLFFSASRLYERMNAHVSPEFRMQTSSSRYDFGAQLKINVRNLSIISNCFEVAMTLAGDGKNAHFDWPSYF